jgi:preprotein translocase subunit YajC
MEPAQPSIWPTLVIFGGLFLFMYFMIIRPQNKRNAQIKDMLSKLEKGSEIIAASGILGKVKDISGAYVSLEIGENNVIKLQKSAIANILPKGTIDSIK